MLQKLYPFNYTRENLVQRFGGEYYLNNLPKDFFGARSESVLQMNGYLIIGEYADNSSRIVIAGKDFCTIEDHYQNKRGVRHIHSICSSVLKNSIFISTGDSKKYLDQWEIVASGKLKFVRQIKRYLAGYTGAEIARNSNYFSTDFSSRPNYIETFDGKKFFFPAPSYRMYSIALIAIDDHYLVSLNSEHGVLGKRKSISIFDLDREEFIYSNYVTYKSFLE